MVQSGSSKYVFVLIISSEILPSQEKVSVQTMLSIIRDYLNDLQIVSSALSIIVAILKGCNGENSQEIHSLLSEESIVTDLYSCIELWNDMKLYDMILYIFNVLFTESS